MSTGTAEDLTKLLRQRSSIKGRISRIYNYALEKQYSEDVNVNDFKVRLVDLENLFDKFNNIQLMIEMEDETLDYEEERCAVEEKFYTTKATLQKHIDTQSTTSNSTIISPMITHDLRHVKLPRLQLPTFDGKLKEWPNFKNIFSSAIDHSTIPDLMKLQYLKSVLKGEAAGLISSLLITNENYAKAMSILNNRYENQVIIVNHHIKAFVNYQIITRNNLKDYLLVLQQSLDSLQALNICTNSWDVLLVFLITQKMDNSLRASWEIGRKETSLPTLKELLDFLNLRVTAFELINDRGMDSKPQMPIKFKVSCNSITENSDFICAMCNAQHLIFKCPDFLKLPTQQRIDFVKLNTLCFNCLKPYKSNHICSKHKCFTCHGRHHTLLHMERSNINKNSFHSSLSSTPIDDMHTLPSTSKTPLLSTPTQKMCAPTKSTSDDYSKSTLSQQQVAHADNSTPVVHTAMTKHNNSVHVLLSTAIIQIQDATGQWHTTRALLDSGSEVNLITSKLALKLKCKSNINYCSIKGIGSSNLHSNVSISTNIASRTSEFKATLSCLVMDNITVSLPHFYIHTNNWNIPSYASHSLADPTFNIPSEIDLLIGAQLFYSIITQGHISLGTNLPHLINSVFGWIISGSLVLDTQALQCTTHTLTTLHLTNDESSDKLLPRFFEQEELSDKPRVLTPDQVYCEQLFSETTTYDNSGRYTVQIQIQSQHN